MADGTIRSIVKPGRATALPLLRRQGLWAARPAAGSCDRVLPPIAEASPGNGTVGGYLVASRRGGLDCAGHQVPGASYPLIWACCLVVCIRLQVSNV
eukprot:6191639-Pleurochrysis_carterae.AAC.1